MSGQGRAECSEFHEAMIAFDASELANWADKPNASDRLPELVARLILATAAEVEGIDMPSGSSVRLPSWDGVLVVGRGNAWAPNGASAWEHSCEKRTGRKASSDYEKRTSAPEDIDVPKTTFVFVTARTWKGKRKWANERRKDGPWADVRALDADDLVLWLAQAPAVAHWFARLIGKLPANGWTTLEEWWENWSSATQPVVSPQLVAAGRQDQVERVAQWFQGDPSPYYVQADTRHEAIAFLAASAQMAAEQWGSTLLARAIVVETVDAWRGLEGHSSPWVLVRDFSGGTVSPQGAASRGHYVLTPLGESDEPRGDGCKLPRLDRDEALQVLETMGLTESRARLLMRKTARRLSIVRRQLLDDAGASPPEWASSGTPPSIAALVLIGQWEEDHAGDKALIERLTGKSYEEVAHDLTSLAQVPDAPVVKVGTRWRFVSQEDAWHLLAPRLTSSDITHFRELAIDVLRQVSPKFDLPVEERYLANVKNKILPHSDALREGMARGLALMGTQPDRARNAEDASLTPLLVVRSVLEEGRGWQIWATLDRNLPTLAEAAPEEFMQAVRRDAAARPSPFKDLFDQENRVALGEASHVGLLWALEHLAWSREHFSMATKILAGLAEIDPGWEAGRVTNRPAESLRSLFLPGIRFSEASDNDRLETLEALLVAAPGAVWRLLMASASSAGGATVVLREPPLWRPWGQDGVARPTLGEGRAFIKELDNLLLEKVGTDARRWADLVEKISNLSPDTRQRALSLLARESKQLKGEPCAVDLWARIRGQLHLHRSHPDAAWAMSAAEVATLDSAYKKLTPSDPVAAYAWLFDDWPRLPDAKPVHLGQEESALDIAKEQHSEARQAAVRSAYESGGSAAILAIVEAANFPEQVGRAVAGSMEPDVAMSLSLQHLGSANLKLRAFALGTLAGRLQRAGWEVLEEALSQSKARGAGSEVLADVFLSATAEPETWRRLTAEGQDVQDTYWNSIPGFRIQGQGAEAVTYAARQLIRARRSYETVHPLAYSSVPQELVIQVLEQLLADVATAAASGPRPSIDSFTVAELFRKLDGSDQVPDKTIARLEVPLMEIVEEYRPELALYREVGRDPSLFADLIAWTFKRSDGQAEESVEEHVRDRRARFAYSVLFRLRGLPGLREDGTLDDQKLTEWVSEARRLCRERGRAVVGDIQIGELLASAPVGQDGVWPCEPVRGLLDGLASDDMGRGFAMGKHNLRGVTSRAMTEGGAQERSLEEQFRGDAARLASKWPLTARWLRAIADDYRAEGRFHDDTAAWTDLFES